MYQNYSWHWVHCGEWNRQSPCPQAPRDTFSSHTSTHAQVNNPLSSRGRSLEARPSTRWHRGSKADWLLGEEASVGTASKQLPKGWVAVHQAGVGKEGIPGRRDCKCKDKCTSVCCTQKSSRAGHTAWEVGSSRAMRGFMCWLGSSDDKVCVSTRSTAAV